jgi:hypothetical protein
MRDDNTMGPTPPETVRLPCEAVTSMGPDELADFECRTFATRDRASLGDPRRAMVLRHHAAPEWTARPRTRG